MLLEHKLAYPNLIRASRKGLDKSHSWRWGTTEKPAPGVWSGRTGRPDQGRDDKVEIGGQIGEERI